MNSKKIIIPAVVLGSLVLTSAVWVTNASADYEGNYPPMIQKLVEHFGLNTDEVDQILEEAHQERHEQMQAQFEERLNQAISNGQITEEQKQLILDKHEEMYQNKQDFMNLSPEEKRTKMQEHKEEMQAWAEENGIDMSQFMPFGKGEGKGFGGGMRLGETCGAVTGALMVLGLRYGSGDCDTAEGRAPVSARVVEFSDRFKKRNGALTCRDLLGCDISTAEGMKQAQEQNLFKTTCVKMVENAAEILEEMETESQQRTESDCQ